MSNDQREDLYNAGMLPKLSNQESMDAAANLAAMQRTAMQRLLKADMKMIEDVARIVDVPLGKSSPALESRHKIGDTVTITAKVAGIQFSDSKVRYAFDLGPDLSIVDSEHVEPAAAAGKD